MSSVALQINQLIHKCLRSAVVFQRFMGASSSSKKGMNPPVILAPKDKATAALIFLHGLGDTGYGWAEQFKDFSFKNIRCIFPHAATKPVSLNAGMLMPSWFDIKGFGPGSPEDEQGIKDASKIVQQLVLKEISSGIPAERIFIGGFSQGGAVTLYTAFGTNIKIGGVLALSCWIPLNRHFMNESTTKYNSDVPMFQGHGEADPMVPFVWGQATHGIISKFNSQAKFKSYSGLGHSSNPRELSDVKTFLEESLKDS